MKKTRIWMIAAILVICGTATAQAQTYNYIERGWDSENQKVTETEKTLIYTSEKQDYTPINGTDTSDEGWVGLYNGWYVVTGNSEYKALNVQGTDVHLLIPDGMTLTVKHVKLESGHKLTIHGQSGDTGKLVANNKKDGFSNAAGIGGGDEAYGGVLVVQGGTIEAKGAGSNASAIGGGDQRGFALEPAKGGLTVYGGSVEAWGGDKAAGIGSGDKAPDMAGYVTIYGGTVKAYGGNNAAGIGGGNEGTGAIVKIYGGTVEAEGNTYTNFYGGTGGAGIGGGREGAGNQCTIYDGTVTAKGGLHAAGIGGGNKGYSGDITIEGGVVTASSKILYNGDKDTPQTGGGAGIGSGAYGDCGFITITGGTVTATSGGYYYDENKSEKWWSGGAGIGGGCCAGGGTIAISGGTVYANGNYGGAGIGAGDCCDSNVPASTITISGGTVYASALTKYSGAAIGFGRSYEGAAIKVTISDGKVIAKAEGEDVNAIGRAHESNEFNADDLTIPDSYMVKAGTDASSLSIFTADLRKAACLYRKYAEIEPCTHSGATIGITDGLNHSVNCNYCVATTQPHTFGSYGECAACHLVSLADNASNNDVIGHWQNTEKSIVLTDRTLYADGSWNTLCLPFNLSSFTNTPLEGATVKTLESASFADGTLTLNFSTTNLTSIDAGKPYIVMWETTGAPIETPVFNSVTISSSSTSEKAVVANIVTFKGQYAPLNIGEAGDGTVLYLGTNNTFKFPDGAMDINAFRAYIQANTNLGDVSGDGKVNVTDVTLLVNHILGKADESFIIGNGDVNGDGEINVTDVTALVNLILGGNSIVNVVVNGADGITFGGGGSDPARAGGNQLWDDEDDDSSWDNL